MRRYFITGLILLLPLALTIAIVVFVVNFFTNPFVGAVKETLQHIGLFHQGILFLSAEQVQLYFSRLIILLLLFLFTVLLGVLTRWVIIHSFIRLGEYIFHRIPIVRSIYKTSKDVINTIFTDQTKSFKQVVLVPFPNADTYSIGLVTREDIKDLTNQKKGDYIAVFVPTTPNPTSGFLMLFDRKDVVFLDMKIEEAFKYIISCGVILTPFKKAPLK
ncbi:putative uncharacterized protein [Waddlia chondrophila 2032/99]|uniref:DUF502 domain-containing protein n=2 Tax=Waddlia chondrophila TaxID=71667 RepID=D6YW92_WADCW|nr:DUF502 domain-containing protein [Waddlia chondrophila]ADI38403.1 conserved hypothetical protein [Waddlia chondrophila WSU 86-1044]CCB91487.1 putative uncharacterized protein [Waddlia chondrophila 2032/99]